MRCIALPVLDARLNTDAIEGGDNLSGRAEGSVYMGVGESTVGRNTARALYHGTEQT